MANVEPLLIEQGAANFMPKRTSLKDAKRIDNASDIEDVVSDKRQGWRANAATARRRQRRYKKRIVDELVNLTQETESESESEFEPESESESESGSGSGSEK